MVAAKGQAEPGIRLGAQEQGWQCGLPRKGRDMNGKGPAPAPWLPWSGQPSWLYCLRHFGQGSQDCLNSSPANQPSSLSAFPQPSGRRERKESPQTSGVRPSTTQGKADPPKARLPQSPHPLQVAWSVHGSAYLSLSYDTSLTYPWWHLPSCAKLSLRQAVSLPKPSKNKQWGPQALLVLKGKRGLVTEMELAAW